MAGYEATLQKWGDGIFLLSVVRCVQLRCRELLSF